MRPGQLRGRVPLEPLDDERLTRLERAVVSGAPVPSAPIRRGHAGGWWLAGAVLAATRRPDEPRLA